MRFEKALQRLMQFVFPAVAQCENVTRPVQITGNTISHCRSGVVVHSRGIATLAENRIFNNSGKGISISADSKRILSDDNEVHDNGGGDIIAQPFDQDAFDTGYKENEIHPHVQEAIDAGKCTYTATENNYYNQLVFRCRTCNLVGSEGMCVVCKDICHKGHDITVDEPKMSSFFCDCGALLNCKACK
jgi:parallel beta-helix repeat protein